MTETRIIIVGARNARRGIGEFVAGWFARHGARVVGIVGTTRETVEQARAKLRDRYAIDCRGYTDLDAALDMEPEAIVALCTPYVTHAEQLMKVGKAGRHCLCEKPLCWPVPVGQDPITPFIEANRFLDVITQWPCTLPTFYALYPEQMGAPIERFEMRLSPTASGLEMIPDSVPHFLSMIRALVGTVHPTRISAEFLDGEEHRLCIAIDATHAVGNVCAILHLECCPQRPRPAWYAINGSRVDREVELASYDQFFRSQNDRIPLSDPLGILVERFLVAVGTNQVTDGCAIAHDQKLLARCFEAAQTATVHL